MITGIKKSEIEIRFNEWLDERIVEFSAMPPLSYFHRGKLHGKIEFAQSAKINFERIIKEQFDGIPPA